MAIRSSRWRLRRSTKACKARGSLSVAGHGRQLCLLLLLMLRRRSYVVIVRMLLELLLLLRWR